MMEFLATPPAAFLATIVSVAMLVVAVVLYDLLRGDEPHD